MGKPQESLRVVVAVDVDLGERVVRGRLGDALRDARLEPGQQQLEAVALLDLLDEFVGRELAAHDQDELLDGVLRAVDVQQTANHDRKSRGIHLRK